VARQAAFPAAAHPGRWTKGRCSGRHRDSPTRETCLHRIKIPREEEEEGEKEVEEDDDDDKEEEEKRRRNEIQIRIACIFPWKCLLFSLSLSKTSSFSSFLVFLFFLSFFFF
jgi:hypothetical protein